jgi:hypothetical protein
VILRIAVALFFVLIAGSVCAAVPDCTGVERWPTSMALVHLKNAGITTPERIDLSKTVVTRLASEEIRRGIYRQIHRIVFAQKSGGTIEVITSNDASEAECSESGVEVFVVSQHLGAAK